MDTVKVMEEVPHALYKLAPISYQRKIITYVKIMVMD
jgi:hypothetical protein